MNGKEESKSLFLTNPSYKIIKRLEIIDKAIDYRVGTRIRTG
jgi:hypothetical protein